MANWKRCYHAEVKMTELPKLLPYLEHRSECVKLSDPSRAGIIVRRRTAPLRVEYPCTCGLDSILQATAKHMDKIYAVTTYTRSPIRTVGEKNLRDRRTVGLFKTWDEANEVVLGNYGDIEEAGYYQYAVVESVPFGLYPCDREQTWYEFDLDEEKWIKVPDLPQPLVDMFGIRIIDWSDIG